MYKFVGIIGISFLLSHNNYAQQSNIPKDSVSNNHLVVSNINKKYYGVFISLCDSYNPVDIILPPPTTSIGHFYSATNSFSNIRQQSLIAGSLGFEIVSKEVWRYYRELAIGISLYRYNVSATETQNLVQSLPPTYSPTYSLSQSNILFIYRYAIFDISIGNYIRILKSSTQRLAAGLMIKGGQRLYYFNSNDYLPNNDIPPLTIFASANLRYDIVLSSRCCLSFEPYYDYELRAKPNTYPRLASFSLRLSALFN